MPDAAHRVRLEGVDFDVAFPSLRLLSAFRMALQPAKLFLALVLLLLVFFGGAVLDLLWGAQPGASGVSQQPYRVFATVLHGELSAFSELIRAAARLEFGWGRWRAARWPVDRQACWVRCTRWWWACRAGRGATTRASLCC